MERETIGDIINGFYITKRDSKEKLEIKQYCIDDDAYYLCSSSIRKRIIYISCDTPPSLVACEGDDDYYFDNNGSLETRIFKMEGKYMRMTTYDKYQGRVFRTFTDLSDNDADLIVDVGVDDELRSLLTYSFSSRSISVREPRIDLIETWLLHYMNGGTRMESLNNIRYNTFYYLEKKLQSFEICETNIVRVVIDYLIFK